MTHGDIRAEAWRSLNEDLIIIIEQRNQLREALEDITQAAQQEGMQFSGWKGRVDKAVAALKSTEEG